MKALILAVLMVPAIAAAAASGDSVSAKSLTGIVGAVTAQRQYMHAVADYCADKYPNLRNMAARTRRDWAQRYAPALRKIPLAKNRIVQILSSQGEDPDQARSDLDRLLKNNAKAATAKMIHRIQHGLDEGTDCMRVLTGLSAGAELDLEILYEDQMKILESLQ